jgi:hypothetical protein
MSLMWWRLAAHYTEWAQSKLSHADICYYAFFSYKLWAGTRQLGSFTVGSPRRAHCLFWCLHFCPVGDSPQGRHNRVPDFCYTELAQAPKIASTSWIQVLVLIARKWALIGLETIHRGRNFHTSPAESHVPLSMLFKKASGIGVAQVSEHSGKFLPAYVVPRVWISLRITDALGWYLTCDPYMQSHCPDWSTVVPWHLHRIGSRTPPWILKY